MHDYQRQFIHFALARGALRFGQFTLKSGRISPYFFNTGLFNSGDALAQLGRFYASAIVNNGIAFDMLFGPAYKGISLAVATAIALAEHYGRDVPVAFNRKEAKDHGEGGQLIGAPLAGRVLIVDDVISAGTSVRESLTFIHGAQATVAGVVISLDRQERGSGSVSAVAQVEQDLDVNVYSLVGLDQLMTYLAEQPDLQDTLAAIQVYHRAYRA